MILTSGPTGIFIAKKHCFSLLDILQGYRYVFYQNFCRRSLLWIHYHGSKLCYLHYPAMYLCSHKDVSTFFLQLKLHSGGLFGHHQSSKTIYIYFVYQWNFKTHGSELRYQGVTTVGHVHELTTLIQCTLNLPSKMLCKKSATQETFDMYITK